MKIEEAVQKLQTNDIDTLNLDLYEDPKKKKYNWRRQRQLTRGKGGVWASTAIVPLPHGLVAVGRMWEPSAKPASSSIVVFDLENGDIKQELFGHTDQIRCLIALPNEKNLASGAGGNDKTIKIWDIANGTCIQTLVGHTHHILCLAATSYTHLASGGADKRICIWDLMRVSCVQVLEGHDNDVGSIVALPNERLASGDTSHKVKFWDLRSGVCITTEQIAPRGASAGVKLLQLPNERLAASCRDTLVILDLKTLTKIFTSPKGGWDLALLPDGHLMIGLSDVQFWNLETFTCIDTFKFENMMYHPTVLPDGRIVLYGLVGESFLYQDTVSTLQAQQQRQLFVAILQNTSLKELDISGMQWSAENLTLLQTVLAAHPSIQLLSSSDSRPCSEHLDGLSTAFKQNKRANSSIQFSLGDLSVSIVAKSEDCEKLSHSAMPPLEQPAAAAAAGVAAAASIDSVAVKVAQQKIEIHVREEKERPLQGKRELEKKVRRLKLRDMFRPGAADLERGLANFNLRRYEYAIRNYDEAIRLEPKFARAYHERAKAKTMLSLHEEALSDFDEAINLDRKNKRLYYERAIVRKMLDDHEGAIKDCDAAIRLDRNFGAAYCERGIAKRILGYYEPALVDFDEAIRLDVNNKWAYAARAIAEVSLQRFEKAIKDCNNALRLDLQDARVYYYRGAAEANLAQYQLAILDYDEALRLDPQYAIAYHERGVAKYRLDLYEEAVRDYDEAIRLDLNDSLCYNARAAVRCKLHDYSGAIADCNEAIRLNPQFENPYCWRGAAQRELGHFAEARADFSEALRLNPQYANTYFHRGLTKYKEEDYRGALEDYDACLSLESEHIEAVEARKFLQQKHFPDTQLAAGTKVKQLDVAGPTSQEKTRDSFSDSSSAHKLDYFQSGELKRKKKDYHGAISDYNEAIKLNPECDLFFNRRGLAKKALQNYRGAIADFNEAIRLNSIQPVNYSKRGASKHALQDYYGAVADFSEAISLDRNQPTNHFKRGVAKTALQDYQGAIIDFNETIRLDPQRANNYYHRGYAKYQQLDLRGALEDFEACLRLDKQHQETLRDLPRVRQALALEASKQPKQDEKERLPLKKSELEDKVKCFEIASQAKTAPTVLPITPKDGAKIPMSTTGASLATRVEIRIPGEDVHFNPADKLGEGGFGIVYRGNYSGREVALKALLCELVAKTQDAFLKELELMIRLRSPQIVEVYGAVMEAGFKQMIVMELMPNGSLYALLRNNAELPMDIKENIALDIAYGVRYLHGKKILHRDLKSLNVLLDDRLRAKISDFGLAEVKTQSQSLKTQKDVVGSTLWMAPELFDRKARFSEKSDIYALAMVLYEMLTHKVPFEEDLEGRPVSMVGTWVSTGQRPELPHTAPVHWLTLIIQCWGAASSSRPDARNVAKTIESWASLMPARPAAASASQVPVETPPQSDLLASGPQYFAMSGPQ